MARILILDDDALVRRGAHRILERLGHEVWESDAARVALNLLTVVAVDVIITDVYMPGMSGLQFLEYLSGRHSNQHVIAMTGGGVSRSAVDLLGEARDLGAEGLLEKPFTPSQLRGVVDTVLRRGPERPVAAAV